MNPLLEHGDLAILLGPGFFNQSIQAGDVIGIKLGGRSIIHMARVAATPGDTIEIRSGILYVNGHKSTWLEEGTAIANMDLRKLEQHHYFSLYDNDSMRENRVIGILAKRRILGSLWFVVKSSKLSSLFQSLR